MEVIVSRTRRSWSREDKAAIVAESCEPHATVSGVARRYGMAPSQLFAWRRELGVAPCQEQQRPGFAPVVITGAPIAGGAHAPAAPAASGAPSGGGPAAAASTIEIDIPHVARVRMSGAVDAGLAAAVLAALVKR